MTAEQFAQGLSKFLTDSQKIPLFTRNKKGKKY
ncbi:hypothetical protein MAN88_13400 [Microcystis aeruginosa]|nr:hypothetical protein MAN88_13400 [Microcystis aeruginosa]